MQDAPVQPGRLQELYPTKASAMSYLPNFPHTCKRDADQRRKGAERVTPPSLRAELIGSDSATALGVEAHGPSPVLVLCRALIASGVEPSTSLAAYRGDTLALKVRAIGEAAGLEVAPHGVGFIRAPKRRRASLASRDEGAASRAPTAGAS
jgi:hypothetical protein